MIHNQHKILRDFRSIDIVYGIQHFGAGKTTLGKEFFSQLNHQSETFRKLIREYPELIREYPELIAEFEKLVDPGSKLEYSHFLCVRSILSPLIQYLTPGSILVPKMSLHLLVCKLIDKLCNSGFQSVFYHFDEVVCADDADSFRTFFVMFWNELSHLKSQNKLPDNFPRVYFYVTGKNAYPFETNDSTQRVPSPIGTHFLVLDALQAHHINQMYDGLIENKTISFDIPESTKDLVLEKIRKLTGGAPRLILYTFRMIDYLKPSLDTADHVEQSFIEILGKLLSFRIVRADLAWEETPATLRVYSVLHACAVFKVPFQPTTKLDIQENGNPTITRWLCRLPFFLHPVNDTLGSFTLELPLLYQEMVIQTFQRGVLPVFLDASCQFPAMDPWRVLELLPSFIFSHLAFSASSYWSDAVPYFFPASEFAKEIPFLDKSNMNKRVLLPSSSKQREDIVDRFKSFANQGVIFPPDKSNSPDFWYVFEHKSTYSSVQFQSKLSTTTEFGLEFLKQELAKAITVCDLNIFVVLCTNFSAQFDFPKYDDNLIRLSPKKTYRMIKKFVVEQPADTEIDSDCITIPENLEVIIPSPELLAKFIEPNRLEKLQKLATAKSFGIGSVSDFDQLLESVQSNSYNIASSSTDHSSSPPPTFEQLAALVKIAADPSASPEQRILAIQTLLKIA